MGRWVWLFTLLLAVPAVGIGVSEAVQAHRDSELRAVLRKEYPESTAEQLDQVTVDRLCGEPSSELRELCATSRNLNLMSTGSLVAGAVGLSLIVLIGVAGRVAQKSRYLLLILFGPGLYLTAAVLIALIVAHAAVAIAAIYYGESALVGRIHVGLIAAIGIGALLGTIGIARGILSIVRNAETTVIGRSLARADAPALWDEVAESAHALGSLTPDHIVVGLDPNFFVTESRVSSISGTHAGRTLYCSLPLCRILSRSELRAIIGHELGHFKGNDTAFSRRFYPIYRGTTSSLAALDAAMGDGSGAIALLPAMAIYSYFLNSFAVAESRISRERELVADAAGASITQARVIASALVKLHAFTSVWASVRSAASDNLRAGKMFANASATFAAAVRDSAGPASLDGVTDLQLAHPTDTHPPLSARLQSLGVSLSDVESDALTVSPADEALALIANAERIEEEISEVYQHLLARQHRIAPPAHSDTETLGG